MTIKQILLLALLAGCSPLQRPPEYFLNHVDRQPEYAKLKWNMLGQTDWNGEIYLKDTTPLFVSREYVLRHEQAHSFEILAARNRKAEYKRFRLAFDKTYKGDRDIEAFPKAVMRALRGKTDKGALLALKFMKGQ